MENQKFDRFLDPTEKQELSEVISDNLINILWDSVYYIASNLSSGVPDTGFATSTSERNDAFDVDTSEGKFLSPDRDCRFRVNFYLGSGATKQVTYICSPATNSGFGSPVPMEATAAVGYVGIKIFDGRVHLVTKNLGSIKEKLVPTSKVFTDDTTHVLEILYRPSSSDIYIDGDYLGSISNNLKDGNTVKSFYPFLTSIKSSDGTAVNMTIEGYEFAQTRGRRTK